jgi:hypothetical protein
MPYCTATAVPVAQRNLDNSGSVVQYFSMTHSERCVRQTGGMQHGAIAGLMKGSERAHGTGEMLLFFLFLGLAPVLYRIAFKTVDTPGF